MTIYLARDEGAEFIRASMWPFSIGSDGGWTPSSCHWFFIWLPTWEIWLRGLGVPIPVEGELLKVTMEIPPVVTERVGGAKEEP